MPAEVIAIVPAGGRSTRLGAAAPPGGKPCLEVGGTSLLDRVCRVAETAVRTVIVVAAEGQPLPPLAAGVEVIRERRPAAGPLAAIHDGLVHAQAAHPAARIAVIAACDMPGLHPAVVRLLVERCQQPGPRWVVPVVGGHPQVLVSAMATNMREWLSRSLAQGATSPRDVLATLAASDPGAVRFLAEAELVAVDPALDSFADVDTPADLVRLGADRSPSIPPS